MSDNEAKQILKQGKCPMDMTPCEYLAKHGKIDCKACISPNWKDRESEKPPVYKKAHIPKSVRTAVLKRDNFTCQQCGAQKNLSIDHIVSEYSGGDATIENCQVLCRSCNSKKGW